MGSTQRSLCAAMLSLQAVVLLLTTPVMITLADVPVGTAIFIGAGLALACVAAAGLLRFRWAYTIGWLIQAASVGLGFVVPTMFALGAVFTALWATAYVLGGKIDRERAAPA